MRKQRISGSRTSVWRFFKRHDITFKPAAAEQERADVARRVGAGCGSGACLTRPGWSSSTDRRHTMMRVGGRCVRGERLIAGPTATGNDPFVALCAATE